MARAGGADREAGRLVIGRPMISRRGALALGFAAAAASPVRAQTPLRIVSVGSSLTEIVYALGAENLLAGVDSTSLFPAAARALPQVGYMRALSAEGVLALKPTLIMATTAAGPAATLDQLRSTGIEVLVLPDHYDYDSVIGKIAAVGKVTGKTAEAEAMIVLVTRQTVEAMGGIEAILDQPALRRTPAGRNGKVLQFDTLLLLGFGPRTPQAATELAAALHPEIARAR